MDLFGIVCQQGHTHERGENAEVLEGVLVDRKYCERCGNVLLWECPSCSAPIRGGRRAQVPVHSSSIERTSWKAPAYCARCGLPYPWTQKRIDALRTAVAEATELSAADREELVEVIPDLVSSAPTPTSERSVLRVNRLFKRLAAQGPGFATELLAKVIVEVAAPHLAQGLRILGGG